MPSSAASALSGSGNNVRGSLAPAQGFDSWRYSADLLGRSPRVSGHGGSTWAAPEADFGNTHQGFTPRNGSAVVGLLQRTPRGSEANNNEFGGRIGSLEEGGLRQSLLDAQLRDQDGEEAPGAVSDAAPGSRRGGFRESDEVRAEVQVHIRFDPTLESARVSTL